MDKSVKVVVLTEEGRGGGALVRILRITPNLPPSTSVVVFCPKTATDYIRQLKDKRISFRAISLRPLSKNVYKLISYLWFFIPEMVGLIRLMRSEAVDVIHCNGSWQFKGVLAAMVTGIPAIWHMNDTRQPLPVRFVFNLLSRIPTGYIYASKSTRQYYEELAPAISSKLNTIISPPVPIPNPLQGDDLNQFTGINVVSVGYINPNKGYELMVEIAFELQRTNPNQYHWHLIGPVLPTQRRYYGKLVRLIDKYKLRNFHFWGYRNDINQLVSSADIYLCTSYYESSPMALWEAMSCRVPAISTNVGDVQEIFERAGCGICLNDRNPTNFVDNILKLVNNPEWRQSISDKAQHVIRETFNPDTISGQYTEIYHQVSNSR